METPEAEIQYFLEVDGQRCGPLALSDLIDAGMTPESMVWWQGLESPARAGKVPKLAAVLKQDRRERQAAERAARLPEPGPIRSLARLCLATTLPAAGVCLVGSTALWAALVIWFIVQSSTRAPAAPRNEGLEITGITLAVIGVLGSAVGLACFLGVSVFLRRLAAKCTDVVRAVAPDHRDKKAAEELPSFKEAMAGLFEVLSEPTGSGGPFYMPRELTSMAAEAGGGGPPGFVGVIVGVILLAVIFLALAAAPIVLCFIAPHLAPPLIGLVVLLVVYAVVHLASVFYLLTSIRTVGAGLNAVIVRYQLKLPWAPMSFAFWTAVSAILLLVGPFTLVPFGMLAYWTYRTSETAALICSHESRQRIAVPLPEKIVEKPAILASPFGD
jgi:hypothetical protein